MLLQIAYLPLLFVAANAVEFVIRNNLDGPILVGILGNDGKPPLENGGFVLNQKAERTVHADENWAGRFWARTWCANNHCDTGDCGAEQQCNGRGGEPPATLVEITLKGSGGQDFYGISLVDGFNVKASITPENGSGNCKRVGCDTDLNNNCPGDLKKYGDNARGTVGCYSSCAKYNADQFCCRGTFHLAETCPSSLIPSASYFQSGCPNAYAFAYDDKRGTFTCKAEKYTITFG